MKASDVVVEIGCGNSPRMALIRDFNIAMATGDAEAVLAWLDDDVVWNLVGTKRLDGKTEIARWLEGEAASPPTALELETILSHGKFASASGTISWRDGTWAMSAVYVFRSAGKTAPIVRIDSFLIKLG